MEIYGIASCGDGLDTSNVNGTSKNCGCHWVGLIRLWCLYGQNNHTTNTTV